MFILALLLLFFVIAFFIQLYRYVKSKGQNYDDLIKVSEKVKHSDLLLHLEVKRSLSGLTESEQRLINFLNKTMSSEDIKILSIFFFDLMCSYALLNGIRIEFNVTNNSRLIKIENWNIILHKFCIDTAIVWHGICIFSKNNQNFIHDIIISDTEPIYFIDRLF
jgi:hypothetical protein